VGLAKQHNKEFEDIMELFEKTSCRFDVLEEVLEGKSQVKSKMWTCLEDLVLMKPDMNEEAYSILINEKGKEEIEIRRKFLDNRSI
jgi:hypothetical protein